MSHQQALLLEGRNLYRQGQPALAISAFLSGIEESLDKGENEAIYWLELAHLFRETGQVERALALNQYGLQLAADDAYLICAARLGLAADLWVLNKPASALAMMQQSMENPALYECAYLLERLSQLYSLQAEWLQALVLLEKAIALYQNEPLALACCGLALLKLQAKAAVWSESVDGIAIVKKYMHLLPNYQREMQTELGHACQALGQFAEAADYFRHALQLAKVQKKSRPRRLAAVEYKLRHMTSDIEIELLREKNVAQHQQVQELENVSFRDELSGLHNARYLAMRWPALLDQADETALCLLSIGIDHFASLREVFGSELAYIAYHQVARILQQHTPAKAILVSAGIGSFSLVLAGMDKAAIEQMAACMQLDVAHLESAHLPEPFSVGMGGAFFQQGDTAEILQLRADLALFLGQRKGQGQLLWDEATK
ncbi:diguanylate cyclase domain-containing protein [Iodobacter arcticus]|uniref:Diguanylate cyclase domain-containing protein n=1 Tax=Iodobacter arcticus TaxID=590593 RepID=A0ABW2QTB4_9NEIS